KLTSRPACALSFLARSFNPSIEKRGQIYFYYSNFGDCAHSETLKANNSLNHERKKGKKKGDRFIFPTLISAALAHAA
ncbi:hypothetical protein ACSLV9_33720, partial [Pseudomonas aeruginosa]